MCLHFDTAHPKRMTAKRDITVFKTVEEIEGLSEVRFWSPYRDYEYRIGDTYYGRLKLGEYEFNLPVVHIGFHSYKYKSEACDDVMGGKEVILKCIIPKGSEYYIGTFAGVQCYASNSIKIIKAIK